MMKVLLKLPRTWNPARKYVASQKRQSMTKNLTLLTRPDFLIHKSLMKKSSRKLPEQFINVPMVSKLSFLFLKQRGLLGNKGMSWKV
ncbi:hypothetical protein Glove_714g8 [Diversispora epigaea]|uniref:Uncharacterized protein n=1 Tax=Diversispora epigaea TaxID=1348612 RepID=A0A397G1R4_9GLOM|nr:hypothetical protein Glove_714g8 [Diversispora epigaea]